MSDIFERFMAERVGVPDNDDCPRRYIITKHETVEIPEGVEGVPLKDAWPMTTIPSHLEDAKLYEIAGRSYIVKPSELQDDW